MEYIKVRLSDENGLNGETAWAYATRIDERSFIPSDLRLILDNNTAYFPVGTEIILQKDGYNVDMVATRELYEAREIIKKYHSPWYREDDKTAKVVRNMLRKGLLKEFVGKKVKTKNGIVVFKSVESDDNRTWLLGRNTTTNECKQYSDIEWIQSSLIEEGEEVL